MKPRNQCVEKAYKIKECTWT